MSGAQFWVTMIINSWCLMEEACSWHLLTDYFRTPYLGGYINDYCQRRYGFGVEKLLVCRFREPSMCNPDVGAHPSTRRDLKSSLASNRPFSFSYFCPTKWRPPLTSLICTLDYLTGSSSICWLKTRECTSSYILYNKEEWSAVIAEAQFCGTMPLDHKQGKDTEVPSGMAERTQLCCESFVAV